MSDDELNKRWRDAMRGDLLAIARENGYDEMMRRARFVAGVASVLDVRDELLAIADDLLLLHREASLS